MKNRIGVVILALVCLGLFIALISIKRQATTEKAVVIEQTQTFSNRLVADTSAKVTELKSVNEQLEQDAKAQKESSEKAITELTNNYTTAVTDLAKTETALKTKEEEVKQRDAKISDLEKENQALDKHATELSSAITNLNSQISDTKQKLASSEGNRAILEKELTRLMGEKTELERQFSDLNVLRAQVSKLKEEMNVARRLEWARSGLLASSEQKGAQKLMQGINAPNTPTGKASSKPNYDLNVEVTSDGSVRVVPPNTNSPAAR